MRINIDATRRGNVARFANHACGSAANLDLCLFWQAGRVLPRVALVTRRAIAPGEELCFEYGAPKCVESAADVPCSCGGAACLGAMPLHLA